MKLRKCKRIFKRTLESKTFSGKDYQFLQVLKYFWSPVFTGKLYKEWLFFIILILMCHNYKVFYYWPQEKRDCKRDVLSSTWFQEELVPFSVYFAVILATPVKDKFKELLCTSHLLTEKRKMLAYEKDSYHKLLHYTALCFINGKGTQRLNYTVQLKAKNIYLYIK